jgi:hypothetical protein
MVVSLGNSQLQDEGLQHFQFLSFSRSEIEVGVFVLRPAGKALIELSMLILDFNCVADRRILNDFSRDSHEYMQL